MKKKVGAIIAVLVLIMLVATVTLQAAETEYKWRFGDAFSAEARHKGFELFTELVEAFTDGRVKITFYPDGILGTHTETL